MPKFIKCNAIPASLLEHEEIIKRAIRVLRSECSESQAIVNNVDNMFAELHEALDGLVMLPEDLMGIPQDMSRIVSIQVQTTRLTGAGVEVVPFKSGTATHWSIYTRNADGIASWVEDVSLGCAHADTLFGSVMVKAAKLSMEHQAFIEQVK